MIFDEFGNMPKINNLEGKLTVSLSRNILYHLYLQDFKQMNEKYGDNIASIFVVTVVYVFHFQWRL